MAVLYIDESGEEGFTPRSCEWFVLGGVVHTGADRQACVNCYDAFKAKHMPKDWYFHFQTRQHDERIAFAQAMREAPYRPFAVVIHKPSIQKPENFKRKYFLYFYALRLLLERVTHWAANHANEEVAIYLSSRGGLRIEDLQQYFFKIQNSPFVKADMIIWSHLVEDDIRVDKNSELRGLQVADYIASSISKSLEPSRFETFEPRYIKEVRPMFERDQYNLQSSIKVWPSLGLVGQQPRLDWLYRE